MAMAHVADLLYCLILKIDLNIHYRDTCLLSTGLVETKYTLRGTWVWKQATSGSHWLHHTCAEIA